MVRVRRGIALVLEDLGRPALLGDIVACLATPIRERVTLFTFPAFLEGGGGASRPGFPRLGSSSDSGNRSTDIVDGGNSGDTTRRQLR